MKLKLATWEDEESFLLMSEAFYEESPFSPSISFDRDKVKELLRLAIESQHTQVLILLLQEDLNTVGLLIGYTSETPFSYDKVAAELAWYIKPSYRGSRDALQLVDAYEAWATKVGCKHVSMSLLPTLTDVSSLYERKGYKKTEISYLKEINSGSH